MKNISNKKWFSIVLAMWITMIIWFIAILILEYIIPFSRSIKWVENSSAAFYQAYSGIEEAMWELSQNDVWHSATDTLNSSLATDYGLILSSNTNIVPPVWKWNSEYDNNWNRLDNKYLVQLRITDTSVNFNSVDLTFRIPDIDNDGNMTNNGDLFWTSSDPMINWVITWTSDPNGSPGSGDEFPVVLNGLNNQLITKNTINNSSTINIWWLQWRALDDSVCDIQDFFDNSCSNIRNVTDVVLKMTLIDELSLDAWSGNKKYIPYLEYQINFAWVPQPWRYSQIETSGKSYGFRKNLDIKVPQISTNQAFDFAVFQ